jgi:CARDB
MKVPASHKIWASIPIALLLAATLILTSCTCGQSAPPSSLPDTRTLSPSTAVQPPSNKIAADLTISAVEVNPNQPQSGQNFSVKIYVKNTGQAASGEYDLAISIKDVSRGNTYPVGTFRRGQIQPGESIIAFSSGNIMVNEPGAHQVQAEITPFLFEDGNGQNNKSIWAFSVK